MFEMAMANLLFRFSSSFSCVPVKLNVGRRRKTVLAHIVGGVHFEGAKFGFSLNYKQKTKKSESEKRSKNETKRNVLFRF